MKTDLIQKIENFRDSRETLTNVIHNFFNEIINDIEELKITSIQWSIDDFETRANTHFDPDRYDPDKFQDALERMIDKHDANIGITWDTIDCYLDEHCLKDDNKLDPLQISKEKREENI